MLGGYHIKLLFDTLNAMKGWPIEAARYWEQHLLLKITNRGTNCFAIPLVAIFVFGITSNV
jgi:hypothetical protein